MTTDKPMPAGITDPRPAPEASPTSPSGDGEDVERTQDSAETLQGLPSEDDAPPGLLIVWWSRTGASRQLSAAAETGAHAALEALEIPHAQRIAIRRLRCDLAGPCDLEAARAYLFIAPENLASLAGEMKAFFDRCYYPVLETLQGRAYGVVIAAGSDGEGAVRQVARIATGWRLRSVAEPLIVRTAAQTAEQILAPKRLVSAELDGARELGATLAGGVQAGLW